MQNEKVTIPTKYLNVETTVSRFGKSILICSAAIPINKLPITTVTGKYLKSIEQL